MKKINIYKVVAGLAVLCLLIALGLITSGRIANAGLLLIAAFLLFAVACRGFALFKGFSYTLVIFCGCYHGFILSAVFYQRKWCETIHVNYAA